MSTTLALIILFAIPSATSAFLALHLPRTRSHQRDHFSRPTSVRVALPTRACASRRRTCSDGIQGNRTAA